MLVRDLMHTGLFTCPSESRLGDVARLLVKHHVHAVIVSDASGEPVGVLSDTDLLAGEWLSTDEASLSTMQEVTVHGQYTESLLDRPFLYHAPIDVAGYADCTIAFRGRFSS